MSAAQVAEIFAAMVKTVQPWDRQGRLNPAGCTVTNRRYYSADQRVRFRPESLQASPRQRITYCRVSSQSQRPDRANQRQVLEKFCVARGLVNAECVEEVGEGMHSGLKKFLAFRDAVDAGRAETLSAAHRD
ncbi:MAG: MerR family transcriptional regulator [Firmicutes bacterium]|nr:MerR family transcriptional regulator [Bacillota bacterium]